ncbi:MAG TPA: urea ABC transporter permease subunit UrtC [Terriglobia bacterium]|nr:urea ABC transporter permease subunit UrtC [Terriglobia bacterium]
MSTKIPRLALPLPPPALTDPEIIRFRKKAVLGLLVLVFMLIPALNMMGVIEPHMMNRLGRYLCFAIAALGIDLIWGYAGVLSLCHALFFCIGGYAMAMHLSLPEGGGDVRPEYHNIPQFFFFNNVDTLPSWWQPFASLPVALLAAFILPAIVAGLVGFFIFRNRVRGVYFSIITQALAWGAFLAFSRNEMLLGGTNGLTNFFKPLNSERPWILGLYLLSAIILVGSFCAMRAVTKSRLGRVLVAIRDNETRLYFLGYRPDLYKAFAFIGAALLAALGGMLYVPQNGIITPNVMRVEDSIWMVIWVAVGGRGRLWGAIFGALMANFTYSALTSDMPKAWPFIQASLFLAALAFPNGICDLWLKLEGEVRQGGRIFRMLLALGFFELALIADKLRLIPSLGLSLAGVQLKYWLIILITIVICLGRVAHASIPLLGLTWFILTEALGLMPSSFSLLKYVLVLATIVIYAYLEGNLSSGIRTLLNKFRRSRPKGEAATVGNTP